MLDIRQNYHVRERYLSASRDSERLALLEMVLESGKALNRYRAYEKLGQTPLFRAVFANEYRTVLNLLATKIDVNHVDIFGNTPLSIACENNYVRIARALIGDCRINFSSLGSFIPDGETLLTRACKNGHIEIIRLLVNSGCPINMPNAYGERPLKVACIRLAEISKEEKLLDEYSKKYTMTKNICKFLIDKKARMEDLYHAN